MEEYSWDELPKFIELIRDTPRSISEKAIAILWYRSHCKGLPLEGLSALELANLMDEHRLNLAHKALPELSALSKGSSYVALAVSKGGFIIDYPARKLLDDRYMHLLDRPPELPVSSEQTPVEAPQNESDLLIMRPNFHGIGFDLKEAWRRIRVWFQQKHIGGKS